MASLTIVLLLFFHCVFAANIPQSSLSTKSAPSVKVKNGTYSGVYSREYNQDFFLGMRYAQPQVRFTTAKSLNSTWHGTKTAHSYAPQCIGYGGDDIGYDIDEDCLFLNVVRPTGIDESAELPVALWIHGGGLVMGGAADRRYNLSFMVQNSMEQGSPVIGVSIQYRLSAFGFLGSKEATDEGITNNGFRDQRLALHWVNENIRAFGGDPDKVTIWGESSGAVSVFAQTIAYNGRDDGLFRGAMAESGFGSLSNHLVGGLNNTKAVQQMYNQLVANTSCAHVKQSKSLSCLRDLPFNEINKAVNTSALTGWTPLLDGDFLADYPPNQLENGNFLKVPVLFGINSDEGTAFNSGGVVNSDQEMRDAIKSVIASDVSKHTGKSADDIVDELMALYPDVQSIGVPSLDYFPVITPGSNLAKKIGLQYRRTCALFGDRQMQYTRRRAALAWAKHDVPAYTYRFDVLVNGVEPTTAATHFQEVAFVFYNIDGVGYAINPFGKEPSSYIQLARTMSAAWINFVAYGDPNGDKNQLSPWLPNGISWPKYNTTVGGGVGQNMVWNVNGSFVETDDFRAAGINWMIDNSLAVFGN